MTLRLATAAFAVAATIASPSAQPTLRSQLIGHWRLVSTEQVRDGEPSVFTLGPSPSGMICYTTDGHMLAQLTASARPKVRAADATAAEARELLAGYTAYFGTFTVDERAGTVTHHRDGTAAPGERDIVRTIGLTGNRLVLTTPTVVVNGKKRYTNITWERLPAAPVAAGFDAAARALVAGTWELVEHKTTLANGEVRRAFGPTPKGLFIFHADGPTTVQIVNPDRPSATVEQATDDEVRSLTRTYLAYFGSYDVDAATRKIVVHTTADLNPMNTGTDQIRYYTFDGDLMYLQPPATKVEGGEQVSRITWRRVR